jgi:hypothetical protein
MKLKPVLSLALLVCALFPPDASGLGKEEIIPDPLIAGMLAQVSQDSLRDTAGGLSGEWAVTIGGQPYTLATRSSRAAATMEKATQYVYERFTALGLETQYHEYLLSEGNLRRNVIAEHPGITEPGCIYILSAHLDSTSENPLQNAPGADDNASGSSAVLEAAGLLSQYNYNCSLRFALFTGEEQGLIGSAAYAKAARDGAEDIRGVLNLDMVGYNSSGQPEPIIELHTRQNSGDLLLADMFTEVVSAYELDLVPQLFRDGPHYSDHASFWQQGYAAIIGIEDITGPDEDTTPYYHRTTDQIESLDFAYLASFAQAAVGTMAHLGGLVSGGYLSGTVSSASTSLPLAGATVSVPLGASGVYSTTTEADGSYLLRLPVGLYTITFQEPWYAPLAVEAVSIAEEETTQLDAQLQELPVYRVNGSVRAAATGAPLSATLVVLGFPLSPVQTDPATGSFTLDLPQGQHHLKASAPHYYPQQRILQLEADSQHDFSLFLQKDFFLPLLQKFIGIAR